MRCENDELLASKGNSPDMFVVLSLLSFVVGFVFATWRAHEMKGQLNPSNWRGVASELLNRVSGTVQEDVCSLRRLSQSEAAESRLHTKEEIESQFESSSWQRLAYEDFKAKILAKGSGMKTFPCIYATMGYRSGEHKYLFLRSDDPSEPQNVRLIGPALESYLSTARSLGPNTSLVIMGAPSETSRTVDDYNGFFWNMLRGLRIMDPVSWPDDVASNVESEKWTFCYAGEPIFPVMLTPAHSKRYSRQMAVPVIALQPKWVLDLLLSTPEKRESATKKVRKLLEVYDTVEVSPDLTSYGQPGTSESRQLCLQDENITVKCPYDDLNI